MLHHHNARLPLALALASLTLLGGCTQPLDEDEELESTESAMLCARGSTECGDKIPTAEIVVRTERRFGIYAVDGSERDFDSAMTVPALFRQSASGRPLSVKDERRSGFLWAQRGTVAEGNFARYFYGPRGVWQGAASSSERRRALAKEICADREAGMDAIVVFGFSRGAVIANAAVHAAEARCPGALASYVYGGFLDSVDTLIDGMNEPIPAHTDWLHVRKTREFDGKFKMFTTRDFNVPDARNKRLFSGGHVEIDDGRLAEAQLMRDTLLKDAERVAKSFGCTRGFSGDGPNGACVLETKRRITCDATNRRRPECAAVIK